MEQVQAKLRDEVRRLFSAEKVDLVIGYEKGTVPLVSRPCFVENAEDVDRLIWDSFCLNNLAVYLPRFFQKDPFPRRGKPAPPKLGILAKGCDLHSVVNLLMENQVPRGNVVIIGVCCNGMVDADKVRALLAAENPVDCADGGDGSVKVTTQSGGTQALEREKVLADTCLECQRARPENVDVLVEGPVNSAVSENYARVKELESQTSEERWQYFAGELSRCIRCYACRQACPNCFCKTCFVEQGKPRWGGVTAELPDTMFFHITRILHQAGRCVACDACVRACPQGIDLRALTRKMVKDVEEMFDFVPGGSAADVLPLCTSADIDGCRLDPDS